MTTTVGVNMEIEQIVEELKKHVRWEMNWKNTHKGVPEGKPDVEIMFEQEVALSILLLTETVFLNNHWWMQDEGWSQDACKTTSLNVNTNDVFAWGVADAEEMTYSEIQDVYEHWERDPVWGTAVWACKKLNLMPQDPVTESIRASGIWDIDSMNLRPNKS